MATRRSLRLRVSSGASSEMAPAPDTPTTRVTRSRTSQKINETKTPEPVASPIPKVTTEKKRPRRSKRQAKETDDEEENEEDEYEGGVNNGGRRLAEPRQPRQCPMPCRESQFNDISQFLESNIRFQSSGCLYVSGVPGTGKTAIVKAVIQDFKEYYANKEEVINVIYINGLTLSAPNRIWKRFYKELNPNSKIKARHTPDVAYQKLTLYFEKQHDPIILIIDELDQILDKQQSILYRLLDWSNHPKNVFSLICIFNTMHLPESILTAKNASRMGMTRCAFPPYTHEELATIVRRSLGDTDSKRLNEALTLLSRKVAAISGDARRALEIAKRTLEIMNNNDQGRKSASAVDAVAVAFTELFSSPKIEAIRQCSDMEKLVLQSIMGELQTSGSEETKVVNVANNTIARARDEGFEISGDQVFHILKNLFQSKLIFMEHNVTSLYNRILLNVASTDIQYALGAAD